MAQTCLTAQLYRSRILIARGLLPYTCIRVYGRVYCRLMLYVPRGILGIYYLWYNYGAPLWTIFGDGMLVRCFRLRSSKIDVLTFEGRCVNLRGSMCRPSKIGDRCVDLRRSTCRLSKIDDRRSMCRPSRIDDRCVDLRRSRVDVSTFEDR